MNLDKEKIALKVQELLIMVSLQTVGRSIPGFIYEIPIPEAVIKKLKEKEKIEEKISNPH